MSGPALEGTGRGGASGAGGRDEAGGSAPDLSPAELRILLDGMSQVLERAFDRLDDQTRALDKLAAGVTEVNATLARQAKASTSANAGADPQRLAQATAQATTAAVRETIAPLLHKIVDAMEGLGGTKALLRQRLRAFESEEAIYGRWRLYPVTLVAGIPLLLVAVLALTVPRAVAQTPLTCEVTGGTWYEASAEYPAACMFSAERR